MVRGRRPTAGEGRFGAGSLMSGFTFTWVKKQGGTAHHAVSRCGPRPARA
ncbi:MAG TPA: hypothetical protein VFA41_00610 [Ktedonobacteraceae bacterium]|nr:hypothetical protein [Ktedonobacteraceae bacterium]